MGWVRSRRGGAAARDPEEALRELNALATSAGARVVGSVFQRVAEPDPATLLGRGKAEEIRTQAHAAGADLAVFDQDLTPTQQRNLEHTLDLKVIDRTQLILDIFARRARSREGQLQVELAQLNYLLPRLSGRGTLLSRLGGGIGTRGPGEQQLEFDRRRIRARIRNLEHAIERVRSQRALHRAHRREQHFWSVTLVGYTNAGKSTLFNALTRSSVVTSDRLFATLDPTVRLLPLESHRKALLSDTVGFIRKLPTHLVAAFRATLEELAEADLLLHVSDASHPEYEGQDAAVEGMLESLGVASRPRLHVWNKVDLLDPGEVRRRFPGLGDPPRAPGPDGAPEVAVSARRGEGLPELLRRVDEALVEDPVVEENFDLASDDGRRLAMLYRLGTVLSSRLQDGRMLVRARLTASARDRVLEAAPADRPVSP